MILLVSRQPHMMSHQCFKLDNYQTFNLVCSWQVNYPYLSKVARFVSMPISSIVLFLKPLDPNQVFFRQIRGSKVAMQGYTRGLFRPKELFAWQLLKPSYLDWTWQGCEPYWFLRSKDDLYWFLRSTDETYWFQRSNWLIDFLGQKMIHI